VLDLLAAHEEDVEDTSEGDGREGDKATGDQLCVGREALESWNSGIQTVGDTTRGADGEEV
jgi:hypothetical protein